MGKRLRSVVIADKHLVIRTVLFLYFTACKLFLSSHVRINFSTRLDIGLFGAKDFSCVSSRTTEDKLF